MKTRFFSFLLILLCLASLTMAQQTPILRTIYVPGIYTDSLRFGVVAAHFKGVASIVITIDNRTVASWTASGGIEGMEHYATLDLSNFSPGRYTLSTTASSLQGTSRTVEAPIWIGESAANKEWTIIEDQVIGEGWAGKENRWQKTRHLLLRRCTITRNVAAGTLGGQTIVLDRCVVDGGASAWGFGWAERYAIDSKASNTINAFGNASLALRCIVDGLYSDAFQGGGTVIDCLVANVDRKERTNLHPDVLQWHERNTENRVVLRLTATTNINAMGIGGGKNGTLKDILIKDCTIRNSGWDGAAFSTSGKCSHVIVIGSTFTGSCLWRVDQGFTAEDVYCIDSVFDGKPSPGVMLGKGQTAPTGVTIR